MGRIAVKGARFGLVTNVFMVCIGAVHAGASSHGGGGTRKRATKEDVGSTRSGATPRRPSTETTSIEFMSSDTQIDMTC